MSDGITQMLHEERLLRQDEDGVDIPVIVFSDDEAYADPLQTQEGGDHYKGMPIQPVQYIHANNIPFMEGCAIKYLSRHREKGGAEDVRKAIHFCQLILKLHYGE